MHKQFIISSFKDGQLQNRTALTKLFRSLKDGNYEIEVKRLDRRSNPQNRYYFGLVIPLIQSGIKDLGTELTKEETHEFLKSRFNTIEMGNHETGEVVPVPLSTTRLNKEQFSEYIGKIQQFAAEFLNVVIPDAGIQTAINYE